MVTKTLSNEYKKIVKNVGTIYYSSPNENACEVIQITMRGGFVPTIDKKDYSKDLTKIKNKFIEEANGIIKKYEWFDNHYIFTTDFTHNGLKYGKKTKYKYQIYVKPKDRKPIQEYDEKITSLVVEIDKHLKTISSNTFMII